MVRKISTFVICSLMVLSTVMVWGIDDAKSGADIIEEIIETSVSHVEFYTPHSPIRINSNADFDAAHGVTSGNGTEGNPWIIENYDINGSGYGYCVYIGNTTDYYTIRNCSIYNASGQSSFYNSGIVLANTQNGTITMCNITHNQNSGIYVSSSNYINILNNSIVDNQLYGVRLGGLGGVDYIDYNEIKENIISNHTEIGIYIYKGRYNEILRNNISNNYQGMYLYYDFGGAMYNYIYHNSFINNTFQIPNSGANNYFTNGYPSGGNYWSDYGGTDLYSGPGQDISGYDGIGDTDRWPDIYPLMEPWTGLPRIVMTQPHKDEFVTNISLNVVANFNEDMNTSVTPSLVQVNGTLVGYVFEGWNSTYSENDTAVWSHSDWNERENVTLKIAGARDLDDNIIPDYTWTFNTTDSDAPVVIETAPIPDSDPPLDEYVVVIWNESMLTSRTPILSQTDGIDPGNWNFLGWSTTYLANDTAVWSHDSWLDEQNVTMEVGDARDATGYLMQSSYTWRFNITDKYSPDVVSTDPYNGETDVLYNQPICVCWNDSMETSVIPTISQIGGFDPGNWVFQGWSTTIYDNDTATWSHDNWVPGDAITMRISGGQDTGGNAVVTDPYDWSFTVGLAPHVEYTNPVNETINVAVNSPYIIKFDKQMDKTEGTAGINPVPLKGSWQWNPSGMWYNFTGSGNKWDFETTYYVNLTGFKDNDGRPLEGDDKFWFTTFIRVSPSIIWANKSGNNVKLEWADGIGPFEIYISNEVDGSGFNFALPNATTSNYYWEHTNVLGDGNSYSYIVRHQSSSNNSEIAWKFAYQVQQPGAPNINWVSVPYVWEHTTLGDVGPDVGNAISWEIRAWNVAAQDWMVIAYNPLFGWTGDTTYALVPGDAVLIFCSQAPGVWDICGAHDSSLTLNIQQPWIPNINWVSMPFHHNFATLGDVGPSVGNAISWEIRAWSVAAQDWRVICWALVFGWVGDVAYALVPGDAVLIFCSQAPGTWTPETNPIGP